MKPDITESKRIPTLREYYLNNAPMAINRGLTPWMCGRSLCMFVEGWLKSGSAPTSRMRRSMAEAYMLASSEPVICSGELIVGQPDFSPFTDEEAEKFREYQSYYYRVIPPRRGRADHMALDYGLLLTHGVEGIISILNEKLSSLDPADGRNIERYEFYSCCVIELEGLLTLAGRYASRASKLAERAEGEKKSELSALAEVLRQVPAKPARTFREALQSIHLFTYSLYGLYSAGRPDQYLLPYYKKDIENGVMTEAEAQELVDCFCLQYIPNMSPWAAAGFLLGGRDVDGRTVENELTWHFLASVAHTHAPDPNVGFCVTGETGEDILRFAARLIGDGHGHPAIWNSDAITESMLKNGFDVRAARLFTHSTCVEVTPIGCSAVSITSPYINLLRVFLEAFDTCSDGMSFEDIFERFRVRFKACCDDALRQENLWQLERGRNGTDPMRISVLIHDCLERGRSSDAGGALYNHMEPDILGMMNVTESFNMLRELIFEKKLTTVSGLQKALRDNYEGAEELLAYIRRRTVHFGTGDERVNALAKRVADTVLDTFAGRLTFRGAPVVPGAFSYRDHEIQGKNTPASPDGRLAGMPLTDGSGPVQGYDTKGPTASLLSTTAWQPTRFLGGTAVNCKLNRNIPELTETLLALIRGYLAEGGSQLQFNIIEPGELRRAQASPERYGDLLVRIGGYSDFFVKLSRGLQDELISREHHLV